MVDTIGDNPHLAMLLPPEVGEPEGRASVVIYDNHYRPVHVILSPAEELDTHEIYIKEPPKALAMIHRAELRNMSAFGQPERSIWLWTGGFVEFDIETGKSLWEWYSGDYISMDESFTLNPDDDQPHTDYVHVNSVDKNAHGNFLLSCRHTDAIYLISGQDRHIIWRLGGKKNDFEKDFEFSRQHDARFIVVEDTRMIISFLNNGAGDVVTNEPTSSAMYVELDLVNMRATLLNRYVRPDEGSTNKRGNMQTLPNDNVLVSWSMNGYMSEFAHNGKLLMEASFASDRYSTYRAYKFPWWSRPSQPPTLVSSCYGVNGSDLSTVFHVSWNGATEVKYWRFLAKADALSPSKVIGTIPKKGFETTFITRGYMDMVSVEALDANYRVLRKSLTMRTPPPKYWPEELPMPKPDDPEALLTTSKLKQESNRATISILAIFAAGFLTSTAGSLLIQFGLPLFRKYARWTYSRVRPDDPEMEQFDLLRMKD